MVIAVGHKNLICENEEVFGKNLREQLESESAEIWVSKNGSSDEYPCLGLLINGNDASLTFFDEDGSCSVSVGDGSDDEVIPFCDGQYEVWGNHIINKKDAIAVLMKFFIDMGRSDSIMWEQLY